MKIVKMAAIATMALTLFASCNKKDEPKKEISSICIRLNETALRAFEDQIPDGTPSKVTDNVKVIINDGAQNLPLLRMISPKLQRAPVVEKPSRWFPPR